MNWRLIFVLSLFGLAMAFATITVIPTYREPWFFLVIFLICAYCIAKWAPGKFFLHGFLVSLLNCVWITAVHIMYSTTYLAHHAQEASQYSKMNAQLGVSPTVAMLLVGPVIGVVSGLILGLFAFVASRMVKSHLAPL
ncbi:MAG TPA: hypothetical protein VKU83_06950 [Puia sp.]|nr:hypothetical protein [Puia sp.]